MKYRSFLRKYILIITGFFWASCGEDDAQPITINEPAPESSSALESSSSESSLPQSSSSSNSPESSSSAPIDILSSSSAEQYKFARDTSVTCTSTQTTYSDCVYTGSNTKGPETCLPLNAELENNTTRSIEELAEIEDELENCVEYIAVPLYGVQPCMLQARVRFEYRCSDGNIYTNLWAKDELLYTESEYNSLFNSSSSEASSSSAAPSPLCQKKDFVKKSDVSDSCIKEKLDSLSTAGETVSDSLKKCVKASFLYDDGEYAKTQICDGDTTVNPRYQAKLDSIHEEVDKAIKDCKAAEVPTDSAKTPADSTVTPTDTTSTPVDTTNTPAE
jgi:hypothetical protein